MTRYPGLILYRALKVRRSPDSAAFTSLCLSQPRSATANRAAPKRKSTLDPGDGKISSAHASRLTKLTPCSPLRHGDTHSFLIAPSPPALSRLRQYGIHEQSREMARSREKRARPSRDPRSILLYVCSEAFNTSCSYVSALDASRI